MALPFTWITTATHEHGAPAPMVHVATGAVLFAVGVVQVLWIAGLVPRRFLYAGDHT
jgi:hypothetical protein